MNSKPKDSKIIAMDFLGQFCNEKGLFGRIFAQKDAAVAIFSISGQNDTKTLGFGNWLR